MQPVWMSILYESNASLFVLLIGLRSIFKALRADDSPNKYKTNKNRLIKSTMNVFVCQIFYANQSGEKSGLFL